MVSMDGEEAVAAVLESMESMESMERSRRATTGSMVKVNTVTKKVTGIKRAKILTLLQNLLHAPPCLFCLQKENKNDNVLHENTNENVNKFVYLLT